MTVSNAASRQGVIQFCLVRNKSALSPVPQPLRTDAAAFGAGLNCFVFGHALNIAGATGIMPGAIGAIGAAGE